MFEKHGLTYYAFQIALPEGQCMTAWARPQMNNYARSGLIMMHIFRGGFYEIGFMAAKANTYRARERMGWTMDVVVGDPEPCPKEEEAEKDEPRNMIWRPRVIPGQ